MKPRYSRAGRAARAGNAVAEQPGDRVFAAFVYSVVFVFAALCFLPFWLVVTGSVTDEMAIVKQGYQLWPSKFSLDAYDLLFTGKRLYNSYGVTVFVTVAGTLLSLAVTSMMAFALSVKRLRWANAISFYVFFTMLFGGGLIPWYLVTTQLLHLKNNIWALIVPYAVNPWYMFLMRNYFRTVPESLTESARIDGARELFILRKIILPLSLPAIATIGLFYALMFWNDWWLSMLLIDDAKLFPLQYLLRSLVSNLMNVATSLNPQMRTLQVVPAHGVRMATCIVTIGPIIFLYPFLQKYFIKGLTIGAIKG